MPNWCSNYLVVRGARPRLNEFATAVKPAWRQEAEGPRPKAFQTELSFDRLIPIPDEFSRENSYGWCMANWGTKWDTDDAETVESGSYCAPNTIVYSFSTANNPPDTWLITVRKAWPDLKFEMFSSEPGCDLYQHITAHGNEYDVQELEEREWYTLVDDDFREEAERIEKLPYKKLLKEFTKDEVWYDEAPHVMLELDVLARFKDENLPMLVGHEWGSEDTAAEFDKRMKGEPNAEQERT